MPPARRLHRRNMDLVPSDPAAMITLVCRACGKTPASVQGASAHTKACFALSQMAPDWEGRFPKPWAYASHAEFARILRAVAGIFSEFELNPS